MGTNTYIHIDTYTKLLKYLMEKYKNTRWILLIVFVVVWGQTDGCPAHNAMKAIQPGRPTTMQMTFAVTRYKYANTQIETNTSTSASHT